MAKPDSDIADQARALFALRGLLLIVLPLVPVIAGAFAVKAHLDAQISDNRHTIELHRQDDAGRLERIEAELHLLRMQFDDHRARGVDGSSHPESIVQRLRWLEDELKHLKERKP